MLRDQPRLEAYSEAILSNRSYFEGKYVLDVGAGTGILSVLCAEAGAKKVYAVEASNVANIAREIVKENGFEEVIEVHQCRIEDFAINNPEHDHKVDIIVSEWMGFYLLHEGMLDSVLFARDKFLKHGGRLFPQTATITLAPCAVPAYFDDWKDLHGVQMSRFASALRIEKQTKPDICEIKNKDLLHHGTVIAWLDLNEISVCDLNEIVFKEVIVNEWSGRYQAVCLWFDVQFPANDDGLMVTLSTSPSEPATHWKQTVILLPDHAHQDMDVREPLAVSLVIKRNEINQRHYNIELTMVDPETIEHSIPCDCIFTKCILIKEHLAKMEHQPV